MIWRVHRAAAVGVLESTVARLADARRADVVGPVAREAEDRGRRCPPARSRRASAPARVEPAARAAPRCRCAASKAIAVASRRSARRRAPARPCRPRRRRRARWSRRGRRPRPSPSPRRPGRRPCPRTRTTLAGRRARPGRARSPRGGAGTSASGPSIVRERVEARERVEQRARRRQHVVEALQDRRALDVAPQLARARRLQRDGADDPGEPSASAARAPRRARRRASARQASAHAARAAVPATPSNSPARIDRRRQRAEQRRTAARRATRAVRSSAGPRRRVRATRRRRSPPARARPRRSPARQPDGGHTTVKATMSQSMRVNRSGRIRRAPSVPPRHDAAVAPPLALARRARAVPWRSAPSRSWRWASASCARARRAERARRRALRRRLGARRLRGDARRASPRRAGRDRSAAFAQHYAAPPRPRRRPRMRTGRPASPTTAAGTVPVDRRDPRLRHGARQRAPAVVSGRRRTRASSGRRTSSSPACGAASGSQRTTGLPARADLLARDGTPLAQGPDRSSPLGDTAAGDRRRAGPSPPARKAPRAARARLPRGAQVGITRPGARLRRAARRPARRRAARGRRAARPSAPRKAPAVRTTIDPEVQGAAVAALAGRLGGVAGVRPRPARSCRWPGSRFSGLQPPGLDLQDDHADRRAGDGVAGPRSTLPGPDRGDARGRRARERQRRVVRRDAAQTRSRSPATPCSRRSAPSSAPRSS